MLSSYFYISCVLVEVLLMLMVILIFFWRFISKYNILIPNLIQSAWLHGSFISANTRKKKCASLFEFLSWSSRQLLKSFSSLMNNLLIGREPGFTFHLQLQTDELSCFFVHFAQCIHIIDNNLQIVFIPGRRVWRRLHTIPGEKLLRSHCLTLLRTILGDKLLRSHRLTLSS